MIITIGGNIGCGKSTVLSKLKDKQLNVITEPIEKWGSWLDLFYSDKKRYSFQFQMKVLLEFLYLEGITDEDLLITERSPQDTLNVFSKALVDSNDISFLEFNLFKEYVDKIGWIPDVYIYLKTNPKICKDRMDNRNRDCENGVTLEYLQQIHDKYEHFTSKVLMNKLSVVYTIDATKDADEVLAKVVEIIELFS